MTVKTSAFPVSPEQTAIAIAYKNPDYALIGEEIMPVCTPVGTEEFSYLSYPDGKFFTVPDDALSHRGRTNEIDLGADTETARVSSHGLEVALSRNDIETAQKNKINAANRAVEAILYYLTLNTELRIAAMVQAAGNYAADCVTALSGESMWSNAASDPLNALLTALDKPLMRPNIMTLSQAGWTTMRTNANVIKSIKPTGSDGAVTKKQVCEYLEIDEILVGAGRVNANRPGQAVNLQYCWSDVCALHYRSKAADTKNGITWGLSVPKGTRVAGSWPDKNIGLEGGTRVRAGEHRAEIVVAKGCGYLFQNIF